MFTYINTNNSNSSDNFLSNAENVKEEGSFDLSLSKDYFCDLGVVISISDGIVGVQGLNNVANVKWSNFY